MNHILFDLQLGSSLLKGSVLLLATLLFACLLRKCSATILYRVWFLGFCMVLALPLVSVIAPAWHLDLLPEQSNLFPATDLSQMLSNPAFPSQTNDPVESMDLQHSERVASVGGTSQPVDATPPNLNHPIVESERLTNAEVTSRISLRSDLHPAWRLVSRWLPAIWLCGAIVIALRTLIQYVAVSRVLKQCNGLDNSNISQLLQSLSRQFNLNPPEMLVHFEAVTPFIAGIWRPRLVLPVDALTWSRQKLTFAFLHELAHIKRQDLLTQVIARMAVAVYWFNPLSWWGYAQLLRLREIACDDAVLQYENRPDSYAETLLEIVQAYRRHTQPFVVGMSGKLDVIRRIHSALDGSRARAPFSKRVSRCVTGGALILCLAFAGIQLKSQADELQQKKPTTGDQQLAVDESKDSVLKTEQVINEEARSIVVTILDEDSKPIVGADLYVTGIDQGRNANLERIHYPTDAQGQATIKFRDGVLSLQLWASMAEYVPQYVGMDEKELTLPQSYTFYLEKGTRLSGKIVDPSGRPISGASVQVQTDGSVALSELSLMLSPQASCSGWLGEDENAAITNADGVWELHNAPSVERNPELKFKLLISHPDYSGDRRWGDYQTKQGITTEQLRNGTATVVMTPGAVLRGRITGPDGKPVTKGLVIWAENPYMATGENETWIQSDGTFQLPHLEPGKYPITVLAPGFAPDKRQVEISQGSPACNFQLEPGHPIHIQFVDPQGKSIPNVYVSFMQPCWRGTSAIYNEDHSNVPDSGIPRKTDQNGLFSWDWAPSDGVGYRFFAKGFDTKQVTLVAQPGMHRVVLTPPLMISGSVIDASTGSPVPDFKAIPVKVFRPEFYSTDFQKSAIASGKNGKYELRVNTYGDSTERHFVRIEADGYRTALSANSVMAGDPPLVEDFELKPAPALVGHVVSTDGTPVQNFRVAIGTPTSTPHFQVDQLDTSFGHGFEVEETNQFSVAASFEAQLIRVFNQDGFAELLIQAEQKEIGEVKLLPYAKISGRNMQGNVPIGAERVYFMPLTQRGLKDARFKEAFSTLTNPDGHFELDRLPPVPGNVYTRLGPWIETNLNSAESLPLELKPGEHKQVTLGGQGAQLTGRVSSVGRSNDEFSKRWSLNWLISRDASLTLPADSPPVSIPTDSRPFEISWVKQPDFSYWMNTKQHYYVRLSEEGLFKVHGVPPGEYDLLITLFDQPAGCLIEAVGSRVIPVTVTAEQAAAESLDLGEIEVECRSGPRPESDMRAYRFANAQGEVVSVGNLSGRYVLFHFWASWCQPCLASMPELKADVDSLSEKPFTAVGFNTESDKARGRAVAEQLNLDWAQNYLGEDSDLEKQLALSSVPAYFLIGSDGKLIASSNDWKEIHKLLHEKLKP